MMNIIKNINRSRWYWRWAIFLLIIFLVRFFFGGLLRSSREEYISLENNLVTLRSSRVSLKAPSHETFNNSDFFQGGILQVHKLFVPTDKNIKKLSLVPVRASDTLKFIDSIQSKKEKTNMASKKKQQKLNKEIVELMRSANNEHIAGYAVKFKGSYKQALMYMVQLEKKPDFILYDSAQYQVKGYPLGEFRIKAYVLTKKPGAL